LAQTAPRYSELCGAKDQEICKFVIRS
jgi:hypothetical protein